MDPISLVHTIARKRNFTVSFEVTGETGPPHMRSFLTRCVMWDLAAERGGQWKEGEQEEGS